MEDYRKNIRVPEDADRDFVAGAFIVKNEKVLFLRHKKYDTWLQPGGHVEEGETPDEAAIRETLEETGLEIRVADEFQPDREFDNRAENLPEPININVHWVRDGHYHVDFLYVARIKDEIESYEYDDSDMKWFSEEELQNEGLDMPENVRNIALEALQTVS